MSLSADVFIDRLRLKNKLTFWRVATVLAVATLVFALVRGFSDTPMVGQNYIARIEIKNIILDDDYRDGVLDDLAEDARVKAVVVRIDSPGGTMIGGQELYLRLRTIAKKKPVVAVMRTMATSAAYMTALGTDHIVAREGSLTGSIGVLIEAAEFTKMAEKLGITPIIIKSAPLKATPSPVEPLTPESRAAAEAIVMDSYHYFVDLVAARRKLSQDDALKVADGRVYTGRQALALRLVDEMGGEDEAISWLATARKVNPDLPVYDVGVKKPKNPFEKAVDSAAHAILPQLQLDGLVSVWHSNPL